MFRLRTLKSLLLGAITAWSAPALLSVDTATAAAAEGWVYTMTNAVDGNRIQIYQRDAAGALTSAGTVPTGGKGTGAGLGNQGGLILSEDGLWLLTVNAGSNSISLFAVTDQGLKLTDVESSRGKRPVSLALQDSTLYVLNADSDEVTGFFLSRYGKLLPLLASTRNLSGTGTGPAQVGYSPDGRTLLVTEKATNKIASFPVGFAGYLGKPKFVDATAATPFGFAFGRRGQVFVTQAVGGAPDASSLGVYGIDFWSKATPIGGPAPTLQTAACWVVVTPDNRYAYTTNSGSSSISGFRLLSDGSTELLDADGVTASLPGGSAPIDMALSDDAHFLYVLNGGTGVISGFAVGSQGELSAVDSVPGLPAGTNGLAAR